MKRIERNTILAALRFLQANSHALPYVIRDLIADGVPGARAMTLAEIDTLCETINVRDVDFERPTYGEFEVERVHLPINEPTAEVCNETNCNNRHFWAVYSRDPKTGFTEWLSDHLTEELARTAAAAYKAR